MEWRKCRLGAAFSGPMLHMLHVVSAEKQMWCQPRSRGGHMGDCKKPDPFAIVFLDVIFFPLVVFPSAGFTSWSKNRVFFVECQLTTDTIDLHLSFLGNFVYLQSWNDAVARIAHFSLSWQNLLRDWTSRNCWTNWRMLTEFLPFKLLCSLETTISSFLLFVPGYLLATGFDWSDICLGGGLCSQLFGPDGRGAILAV